MFLMSYIYFEDRVASCSALGLVKKGNNVLTIYRHPATVGCNWR